MYQGNLQPILAEINEGFELQRQGCRISCGLTAQEFDRIARLRAEVFCDELRWVRRQPDGSEFDRYDNEVTHIGIFERDRALGTLRIHDADSDWMLLKDFPFLLDAPEALKPGADCCEVSRLAVREGYRKPLPGQPTGVADYLYQALFSRCMLRGVRYVYMVVSSPVLRVLRSAGLPVERIGPRVKMPDGVVALAGRLDWQRFIEEGAESHPWRVAEYMSTLAECERRAEVEHDLPVARPA